MEDTLISHLDLAIISKRMYEEDPKCHKLIKGRKGGKCGIAIIKDDTQDSYSLVVAFEGSKDPIDFVIDACSWKATMSGFMAAPNHAQKVHAGFLAAWEGLRAQVITYVMSAMDKDPKIVDVVFTGHSLGGAMAVLAAYDFNMMSENAKIAGPVESSFLFRARRHLVTFGCPKVFKDNGSPNQFDDFVTTSGISVGNIKFRVEQYSYREDPVTTYPRLKYRHVVSVRRIGDWTLTRIDNEHRSIKNHDINNYISSLKLAEILSTDAA